MHTYIYMRVRDVLVYVRALTSRVRMLRTYTCTCTHTHVDISVLRSAVGAILCE